jgi:thiol-disulfide isomerase/thioredoxin
MNRKTILYVTLGVVILAVVVAVGLASRNVVPNAASQAPIQSSLKVGDVAPEFTAQSNAGPFDLASVTTPVLLEVFATWCPHCQHETAILNDLAAKYQGKIAMIAVDGSPYGMDGSTAGSESDVNQFGARFAVRYPIAFDPQLAVAQKYLQGGFPTIVLIRPDKKIAWIKDGEVPENDLVKAINAVIPGV